MFRTTIKTLSLFRKNSKPKLYCDAFNMFIMSAFVKESTKNTNSQLFKYNENHDIELKIICEITGCDKNNKDCNCKNRCIVTKSETTLICEK